MTHSPSHRVPLFALCTATLLLGCGSVEYGSTSPRPAAPRAFGSGPALEVEEEISIEVFYEELAAYGEWIDAPRVGRVFVPHDPDYRPYQNGRWVQRDEGLVWVSYDAIGWAVCHYGSWAVLDDQRWAWVPDTRWGPGWVEWRENPQYVGWSPRMAYVAPTVPPQTTWVFVQTTYLLTSYVSQSFLAPAAAASVYRLCPPMQARPDRAWIRSRGVRQARAGSMRLPSATAPGRPVRRAASGGRGARRGHPPRRAASRGRARAAAHRPDASGGYAVGGGGTYAARPGLVGRPRLRETVVIGGRSLRRRSITQGPARPHLTLTGRGTARPSVPPVTIPQRDLAPRTVRPVLRQPNLPHPAVRHARSAPDLQVPGAGPEIRGPVGRPPRVVRPTPNTIPPPIVRGPRPRVAPAPPPRAVRPQVAALRVVAPRVTAPRVTAPRVTAPRVTAPRVVAPPPRVARPTSRPRRPRTQRRSPQASITAPASPRRAVGGGGLRVRR